MTVPSANNTLSLLGIKREVTDGNYSGSGSHSNISLRAVSAAAGKSTPDQMTEFWGYSSFSWGTPGTPSPTTYLGHHEQENRNGNDTDVVSTVEMTLTNSGTSGSISFRVRNTDGDGGFGGTVATSYATVTYSGALTSLEARWAHTGLSFSSGSSDATAGKVFEIFSNSSFIDQFNVANLAVTGATASGEITSTGTFNGGFSTLRTTSGNMSAAVAACTDNASAQNAYSHGIAEWGTSASGGGDLTLQLRANGNTIINLVSQSYTNFTLDAKTEAQESTP